MKWIRKILVAGLILWLALGLISPGVIGLLLERQAGAAIAGLDRQLGQYDIRASALERRWFSSRMDILVASAEGKALFRHPLTLQHGFLNLKPRWLQGQGELISTDKRTKEVLFGSLGWQLTLLGQLKATLRLQPASGYSGALSLTFQPLSEDWELTSPGISGPGFEQLRGRLTLAAQRAEAGLAVRANQFSGPGWALDGVELSGQALAEGNLLDLRFELVAGALSRYGMAPFGAGRWQLNLNRLSLPLLIKSLELRDSQSALALLPPLLERQPEIDALSIDLDHPELGAVSVRLSAALSRPPPAGFLLNPRLLLAVLQVEAQALIAEGLAVAMTRADYLSEGYTEDQASSYAKAQWDTLLSNGWLQRQGMHYETTLTLNNGELVANGVVKQRY